MESKRARKLIVVPLGLLVLVLLVLGAFTLPAALTAGTSIVGKTLCSALFVAGRDKQAVLGQEPAQYPDIFTYDINEIKRTVDVTTAWQTAHVRHYPGLGCIRWPRGTEAPDERPVWAPEPPPMAAASKAQHRWHNPSAQAEPVPLVLDATSQSALQAVVRAAFEDEPGSPPRQTRAVAVVWRGHLVAEHYAPGFAPDTPLLGWSMAKSLTNALVGMRVLDGALALQQQQLLPQWQDPADPRGQITLDALLRMSSGLEFDENYFNTSSDAVRMLFADGGLDMANFAASKSLAHPVDTHFAYSSGTTNILQRIVRNTFTSTRAYLAYVNERLLQPLGMQHTQLEPDVSGTLVGSSFAYASARDWVRFGQFFLQQGVWQGQRLLPADWVSYSTTATATAPEGNYGAHWWLNVGPPDQPGKRSWPQLPQSAYRASGFEGQSLMVVPEAQLVLVRLGLTVYPAEFDIEAFTLAVLQALGEATSTGGVS